MYERGGNLLIRCLYECDVIASHSGLAIGSYEERRTLENYNNNTRCYKKIKQMEKNAAI